MPDVTSVAQSWSVVVPVKRLDVAKTRITAEPETRRRLALAMATDTVAACLQARPVVAVVVVTDDGLAAPAMRDLGAIVVADEPDAGLNPALSHGAKVLQSMHPRAGVVLVSSDLPALTAAAVTRLLARAAGIEAGCVADAAGTGTTALTMSPGSGFVPSFGPSSWQRHVDAGAADLTKYADPRLRRDVDTTADLADAMTLGCGSATVAVVSAHPTLLQ